MAITPQQNRSLNHGWAPKSGAPGNWQGALYTVIPYYAYQCQTGYKSYAPHTPQHEMTETQLYALARACDWCNPLDGDLTIDQACTQLNFYGAPFVWLAGTTNALLCLTSKFELLVGLGLLPYWDPTHAGYGAATPVSGPVQLPAGATTCLNSLVP